MTGESFLNKTLLWKQLTRMVFKTLWFFFPNPVLWFFVLAEERGNLPYDCWFSLVALSWLLHVGMRLLNLCGSNTKHQCIIHHLPLQSWDEGGIPTGHLARPRESSHGTGQPPLEDSNHCRNFGDSQMMVFSHFGSCICSVYLINALLFILDIYINITVNYKQYL